ncbi:hypothetical protein NEAUS03_1579 [Nematocida ausubeli]|nr:hypothetical protein NEAUS03_1579 [Nematocida ausubeli]
MTSLKKSSSNEKKKQIDKSELQGVLRQPEQPSSIKDATIDNESSSSSQDNIREEVTPRRGMSEEAQARKQVLKAIGRRIKFDNNAVEVLESLRVIWYTEDPWHMIGNHDRLKLISMGIDTSTNENLFILRRKLVEYTDCLGREETLGNRKTWEEIERELEIIIAKYAKCKLFRISSIKNYNNDWERWLKDVFVAIAIQEYTLTSLRVEVENNLYKYPSNWLNVNWDQELWEIYKQLLRTSPKKDNESGNKLLQEFPKKLQNKKTQRNSAEKTCTHCKKKGHLVENCYAKKDTTLLIDRFSRVIFLYISDIMSSDLRNKSSTTI